MNFAVGSLVRTRGREWIVQPESKENFLLLKPLGGTDDETTGVFLPLESVTPAQFALPESKDVGDANSAGLLRDAVKLSFRSSTGPFRSFARIAVEPRPYQLVPLLMALKLDPVRLLVADDVGIGKTVETLLIARELLDRGEVNRLAILCPPHLAEQWQDELKNKFHIEAELVLPSTASRLERHCRLGESIFDRYPFVIISTDFIKSERRRADFTRTAPELVIVDEAHTCVDSGEGRGSRHQRYQLLKDLAANPKRHLLLVTATPHSGKEAAFRSLLSLLQPQFANLPDDLSGPIHEKVRRDLAQYFVQRKRGDIRRYLDANTPFPDREDNEIPYVLTPEYKQLFDKVLKYTREIVSLPGGSHVQRVRWWAALGLLRALASSPAAAVATLRNRAAPADTETPVEADEVGRRTVLDFMDGEATEGVDITPGSDIGGADNEATINRRRLLELAKEAESLYGAKDKKLSTLADLLKSFVKDDYAPIVFCRFIQTAEYLAEHLRELLPRGVEIAAVTGTLPPEEREARVLELAKSPKRVLVATDCLSEGVNLQDYFNAVIHYDLAWNPTRHEQREGRVDRYGQPKPVIRVRTMYGLNNQIDGIVLDVLIRKHKKIRSSLGISIPVPVESDQVVDAIFEGLLLRGFSSQNDQQQALFDNLDDYIKPKKINLNQEWDRIAEREKRSRTVFAQETIKVDEVAKELEAIRSAIGSSALVQYFMTSTAEAFNATITTQDNRAYVFDFSEAPKALREIIREPVFKARFELPVQENEIYLNRTHPVVEGLATYIVDTTLDTYSDGVAKRAGVIRTRAVDKRTTLLTIRFRYQLKTKNQDKTWELLAEDTAPLAFIGSPQNAVWLSPEETEKLLLAEPHDNIEHEQAQHFVQRVRDSFADLLPRITELSSERGDALLEAHRRVRTAAQLKGIQYTVQPLLPSDVLGIYVYLPV
jgi:SNF2 family DNA or RNA helicase